MGNDFDLTWDPIEPRTIADRVRSDAAGAVVTFEGVVRNHHGGREVVRLSYEAFEPMARKKMSEIGAEVEARWPGSRITIVHRLGELGIGDVATVVAVSSAHRAAAFDAVRFAMERVKEVVPIWKKEWFADGTCHWVRPEGSPVTESS
jgi:molybdopterin synthase catalytic subunit